MAGKKKIVRPRYQQIAVDLAERIVENRYQVGEKIHARSTLASTYNVFLLKLQEKQSMC